MRRIFTIALFVFAISIDAQEAGRAGELLKNEASKSEMQTQKSEVLGRGSTSSQNGKIDNSGFRNPSTVNSGSSTSGKPRTTTSSTYNWNQNFGYAEVFLRIPESGYFTVEIGNQMISNASGKFRFFDLNAGKMPMSIYQNGYLVYRTTLNVRDNSRLVLDYFSNYGLYLLNSTMVQGQTYGFNQWDDLWNSPYGNSAYGGNTAMYGNVMNPYVFSGFMRTLEGFSFDSRKTEFLESQFREAEFTSEQIRLILNEYDFDSGKLKVAKMLYSKCVDRQNFFMVYDAFSFDSNKRELMNYIARV